MARENNLPKVRTTYADELVAQARKSKVWNLKRFEDGKFVHFDAPVSIIARLEQDLPINKHEAKFFEWLRLNAELVESVIETIKQLIAVGHDHYEMRHIIGGLRLQKSLKCVQTDRFKINDHLSAYLSRMMNELFGCGFFKVRHTDNEPGSDEYGTVHIGLN